MNLARGNRRYGTARRLRGRPLLVAIVCLVAALGAPETRAQCPDKNPLRNPYFGDLHVHSAYSFDAIFFGTTAGPREAYDFAQGASIALSPYDIGETVQLRRPLDFAAVTEHSEFLGEGQICTVPGVAGYDSPICQQYRDVVEANFDSSTFNATDTLLLFLQLAPPLVSTNPMRNEAICGPGGIDCPAQASLIWADIQAAAEEKNGPCQFTTFLGWEWTAGTSPGAGGQAQLHRNVIFRSAHVPSSVISFFEEPTVEGLWESLVTSCFDADPDCDALTIPHNSNFSNGKMFTPFNSDDGTPLSAEDAAFRASIEPVVEIHQHKGSSECRPGALSNDELCGFESLDRITPLGNPVPGIVVPPLSFVRNGLKEGLAQEQTLGVNPFPIGFVGSTDGHNADPGATSENEYGAKGHQGVNDWSDERILNVQNGTGIESNGGGLAVIWAAENTRAALFDAIRRREVYGTSGTRPILRTFAGDLPRDLCNDPTFDAKGYMGGVPMGGEIGAVRGSKSPRFAVRALQDPGAPGEPGTPLQRIQMVKGWVDSSGTTHEKVYEIAGDPNNGATVDLNTCTPQGSGFSSLCTVWQDPDFDPSQRAFYYARVLENPICRWHRALCNGIAVDCNNPGVFSNCCNGAYPDTVQERAWSSPVFYRPEAAGRVRGRINFGKDPGEDILNLSLRAQSFPAGIDPGSEDLSIELVDDDTIYAVTLPAGSLQKRGQGWSYRNPAGQLGGLRFVAVSLSAKGRLRFRAKTARIDLSTAEASSHEVELRVSIGSETLTHRRLWKFASGKLGTG